MCAARQGDGVPVEADQLGNAQAGLDTKQEQGVITTPDPGRSLRHGKKRFDFRPRQKMNRPLVMALARYRQNPLDMGTMRWFLEGGEIEEGSDRRQAKVASSDTCGSVRLEVVEEFADERRVEVAQIKGRRQFAQLFLRESEQ
jgi:membrane carboxypeptidase/penicillin-binding protein PbpC